MVYSETGKPIEQIKTTGDLQDSPRFPMVRSPEAISDESMSKLFTSQFQAASLTLSLPPGHERESLGGGPIDV